MNGDLSKLIKLYRSVQQGCPLAPYLFVLVADLFILMIKSCKEIKGLELPGGDELKALAVADDSQVVSITTLISLNACAVVIRVFCSISGMVINWSKTVAIAALPRACICRAICATLEFCSWERCKNIWEWSTRRAGKIDV